MGEVEAVEVDVGEDVVEVVVEVEVVEVAPRPRSPPRRHLGQSGRALAPG